MNRRNALLAIVTIALTGAAYAQAPAPPAKTGAARKIVFNGRALSSEQLQRVEALERASGVRIPDSSYWYDNRSGAVGLWQGPALAAFPAGLELGGPLPVNASHRVYAPGELSGLVGNSAGYCTAAGNCAYPR